MPNDGKITIACPHCGSTGTYTTTVKTGHGDVTKTCNSCRKMFRAHLKNGDVDRVVKA